VAKFATLGLISNNEQVDATADYTQKIIDGFAHP